MRTAPQSVPCTRHCCEFFGLTLRCEVASLRAARKEPQPRGRPQQASALAFCAAARLLWLVRSGGKLAPKLCDGADAAWTELCEPGCASPGLPGLDGRRIPRQVPQVPACQWFPWAEGVGRRSYSGARAESLWVPRHLDIVVSYCMNAVKSQGRASYGRGGAWDVSGPCVPVDVHRERVGPRGEVHREQCGWWAESLFWPLIDSKRKPV